MIFVPLAPAQLEALIDTGELTDLPGHTATATLRRDHGLGADDHEDADFVAFGYAEGAAVALADRPGTGRTVIAADVAYAALRVDLDDPFGSAVASRVGWAEVTAVYFDEPDTVDLVVQVRAATAGLEGDDVYADRSMQTLLAEYDLLWHLPSEVAH